MFPGRHSKETCLGFRPGIGKLERTESKRSRKCEWQLLDFGCGHTGITTGVPRSCYPTTENQKGKTMKQYLGLYRGLQALACLATIGMRGSYDLQPKYPTELLDMRSLGLHITVTIS